MDKPAEAPPKNRINPGSLLLLLVLACSGTALLALRIPNPPETPIGDAYQIGTGRHRGVVVKVDPQHAFPDRTVREGWLLRADDGFELWFPRDQLKKAELVRR